MNILNKVYFVICLFIAQFSHAQTELNLTMDSNTKKILVSGKVTTISKEPIPYAHVVFINLKTEEELGLVSNENEGYFSVELPSGEYIVQVSVLGYSKYTEKYHFLKDTVLPDIILKEQNEQLDEVIIKADISKNIKHSATSMIVNIQNDSLYKKMSTADVLALLPGVQVDEEGSVKLEGESATITIDGKSQRMTSSNLMMLLESMQGHKLESIELINTPSAKYSGNIKKVIDINLKKQREDGLAGSFSTRISNTDFAINSSTNINYKTGKFVFSGIANPYDYSKRSWSNFTNTALLNNSLAYNDEKESVTEGHSSYYKFGIDYTINKKHSVSVNVNLSNSNSDTEIGFATNQFAFEELTIQQFNSNNNKTHGNNFNLDFAYRYDIGTQGSRLDFASSYRENESDNNSTNENELIDVINYTSTFNINRDNQDQKNTQYSSRLDYVLPLNDKKDKFEAGIKYDDLSITDANLFENFNTDDNVFEVIPNYTNAFEYNEQVYTGYASFASSLKKLKYSLGLRLEHVETQSFSETENQIFNNTFSNFLPVIALKYMTNEKQTSNIGLSYRKGYNLPPYIQLNPFETFVNSYTVKRGNPELTQSIYNLFRLSYTLNNKYFFTLNANFYNNLFETTQILEDDITFITFQNLGTRSLYRANFDTTFKLFSWWRLNVNPMFNYSIIKSESVDNDVFTWQTYSTNTFTLPNNIRLNLTSIFSNGDSNGLDTPNSFLRINTNLSLSKRFLKDKLSTRLMISDIFGMINKNESSYTIDNTSFSSRTEIQIPMVRFTASYRFVSGKKISKKGKKSSGVDSSRF